MNEQIANNQRRENQKKQERRSDNRRREEHRKDNSQAKQQLTDNKSVIENKPINPIVAPAQRNNNSLQTADKGSNNNQYQNKNNNGVGNPQVANKVNSNQRSQQNENRVGGNAAKATARPNNRQPQQKEGNNVQIDNKAKDRVQSRKVKSILPEREEKGDNYKNDLPVQPIRSVDKKDRVALRVGITHGDFNGVSYEIMFKSLFNSSILDICKPIVYGHSKIAAEFKKIVGMSGFGFSFIKQSEQAVKNDVYLVNVSDKEYQIQVGQVTKEAGELAFLALERAVSDIKANKIDVIVTAPINKNAINQAGGFDFPGHTEYFADRFSVDKTLMLMVADNLRVAVATNHVPVDKLNEVITKGLIVDKVNILNNSLKRDFAIDMPKIAILSLNPHAGDGGVIGSEELDVILPAVNELRDSGMIVNGPFAADGFFSSPNTYGKYDAVLAMYHDQGMIPFKMIAGDRGVNFTVGLPIVRTSPAHGTAFDIAGQNIASHTMLLEAIFTACDIYRNRKEYDALVENRLK